MNTNTYKELYSKRAELQKERSPLAYRLESKPDDRQLKIQVKQLTKKIDALTVVLRIYSN